MERTSGSRSFGWWIIWMGRCVACAPDECVACAPGQCVACTPKYCLNYFPLRRPPPPCDLFLCCVSTQCFHACWHDHIIHIFHAHSAWLKTSIALQIKSVVRCCLSTGVVNSNSRAPLKGKATSPPFVPPVPTPVPTPVPFTPPAPLCSLCSHPLFPLRPPPFPPLFPMFPTPVPFTPSPLPPFVPHVPNPCSLYALPPPPLCSPCSHPCSLWGRKWVDLGGRKWEWGAQVRVGAQVSRSQGAQVRT